jgi:hypothetical protein
LTSIVALIEQQAAQFLFRKIFGALRVGHGRDYTAPAGVFFNAGVHAKVVRKSEPGVG